MVEARIGCAVRASFGGISRILFPLSRVAVIYLARFPERPAPLWRRRSAEASPKWCGVRLIPEVSFSARAENRPGDPLLCFVLHRMGFLLQPRLREGSVGSYPAFSTLPRTALGPARQLSFESLVQPQSGAGRYIFCDTVRHPGLTFRAPPISRGMLPSGVRTFLWQNKCQASDHPPRLRK